MRIVLDENAFKPIRAHAGDAGLDLMTPRDVYIESKGSAIIDTGVHIELHQNEGVYMITKPYNNFN